MDLMFQPLRKYADFDGRARRAEYWLFQLLIFLLCIPVIAVAGVVGAMEPDSSGPATMALGLLIVVGALALIIPGLAVSVRRLHDIDLSGWWLLLAIIPFGGLVLFVMSLIEGTRGPNRHGPDPKGAPEQTPIVQAA